VKSAKALSEKVIFVSNRAAVDRGIPVKGVSYFKQGAGMFFRELSLIVMA